MRTLLILLLSVVAQNFVLPSSTADSSGYRLAAYDNIRIQVYGEPELEFNGAISEGGIIVYPVLGELLVAGLSVQELAQLITQKLETDYLVAPKVNVVITRYRNFFVGGWVKQPGALQYNPGLTIRKAIALAGGFRKRAAPDDITIIRQGSPELKPTNLDDFIYPDDVIIIGEEVVSENSPYQMILRLFGRTPPN